MSGRRVLVTGADGNPGRQLVAALAVESPAADVSMVALDVRETPRERRLPQVSYATADIRQRCTQLGVDAVFDKSNEIDALVDYCIQQSAAVD